MTTIQPTVGRKVWYRLGHNDDSMQAHRVGGKVQPLDATIVAVHSDSCVNLVVFDALGHIYRRTSILLLQGEDSGRKDDYCHWMPYQVGQAKAQEPQRPDAPQMIKPQPTANKVTQEQIDALKDRLIFRHATIGTSTFVHTFLDDKFYIASGHSACVDPANFNEVIGLKLAQDDAMQKAEQQLWLLEGYALWKQMQAGQVETEQPTAKKHLFTKHDLMTMINDAKARNFDKIVVDNIVYEVFELQAELDRRSGF